MTLNDHLKLLLRNGSLFLIYFTVILSFPVFSIFAAHELIPYVSLIYQIGGIILLYLDEKYKMDRTSQLYGRLNTFLYTILNSFYRSIDALKWSWIYIWAPPKDDCNITFDVKVTQIIHEYSDIEDSDEKAKAQMGSIESDLDHLRYFSQVRKGGYVFMSIGFIMQFFSYILQD